MLVKLEGQIGRRIKHADEKIFASYTLIAASVSG